MKTINKHIGIIGGMGPQASVHLHRLILEQATGVGAKDCHDFPLITHVSLPVKDFINDPSVRFESIPMLRNAANIMRINMPDAVVIACNTAHLLLKDIDELKAFPLVSLPELVIEEALEQGVSRLGLLASPTTLRTKLYQRIASNSKVEIVPPDRSDFVTLESIIRRTIAGRNDKSDHDRLTHLVHKLMDKGAEKVALGCTELSVIAQDHPINDCIDSLTTAAKRLVVRQPVNESSKVLA